MKTIITSLTLILFLVSSANGQPQFQKNVGVSTQHYHDMNIEPLDDGSRHFVVAGNLFDNALANEEMFLKRVDENGNIIWHNKYDDVNFPHMRIFDAIAFENLIVITGAVDVAGTRKIFIAKIDGAAGAVISAKYYDPVSPNFHSRGLHIKFTDADATGNGSGDIGFIVVGYFADCYNVNIGCNNNIGLAIRTDFNLNLLWTVEIDSLLSTNVDDYDFANDLTVTDDGYFISGGATVQTSSGFDQQAVLAHKLDFLGNQQWDQSYYFGNSRDLSVDSYYDSSVDELYMLANYSISHYFGVTLLDDSVAGAGAIDLSRSWFASGNDLNRYGFTIMESLDSANNLVISGYDRDENWVDGNNNSQFGQSNLFVYEFDKTTGNQVGNAYQYLVPHTEPAGDDFNFWFWQMPLMFYPDISFPATDPGTNGDYYHVGYRNINPGTAFGESELVRTSNNKINNCDRLSFQLNRNTFTPIPVTVSSGFIPNNAFNLPMNTTPVAFSEDFCEATLSIPDNKIEQSYLYPNPAKGEVFVEGRDMSSYEVYNSLGSKVLVGSLLETNRIDLQSLPTGLYFIQVQDNSANAVTLKLLIE